MVKLSKLNPRSMNGNLVLNALLTVLSLRSVQTDFQSVEEAKRYARANYRRLPLDIPCGRKLYRHINADFDRAERRVDAALAWLEKNDPEYPGKKTKKYI